MDWNEIRNEFPVCKKCVYLNAAGGSPLSASASREGIRFYQEMLEEGDTLYEEWMNQAAEVRAKLAAFIGAKSAEIAFTGNTSQSMNFVSHFLKGKGDVLTMKHEFPSTTIPWLNQHVTVKMVEPDGVYYPIEKIEKSIDEKTRILVTSYIQYSTGFRQDLEALGEMCRKNHLIFVVNATQAMGIFPIDVRKYNIDFLVFSGLKWATAGYGAGGIYINEKWLADGKLPFAGWQSVEDPGQMDNLQTNIRHEASVIEGGCPSFPTVFALGGAIDLFSRIGKENVVKRVLKLSGYLSDQLMENGFSVYSPKEDKYRSGIVMVETLNAKKIAGNLAAKKIYVSARGQGLRASVSIFNNKEDIDTFIQNILPIKEMF